MSNDRTNPQTCLPPWLVPANPTQTDRLRCHLRNFCDTDWRFVGKPTKHFAEAVQALKKVLSPLSGGYFQPRTTHLKKHGTQHAMKALRGQQSGRIVTPLTRLTGTPG
jgi:hypothetical protein